MIKIFHTADVHIGKKYDRYSEDIRKKLIASRFECLKRAVRKADEESCDFFVIAGDLFDRVNGIAVNDVKKVVGILANFGGTVIVMPGNHDYYNEEVKVWRDFKDVLAKTASNIVLMAEMKEYSFTANGECVYFYPALCQSKHSEENSLGWIKERTMDERAYHIGIAHGSVDKYSPDFNKEYYPMTEKELTNIPVDAWLLGHTHVPFPNDLREDKDTKGYVLFNPGTIEQTDFSNNTEGLCFILTVEKQEKQTVVKARKYVSGAIRYYDIPVTVTEGNLKKNIREEVKGIPEKSVLWRLSSHSPSWSRLTESRVRKSLRIIHN